MTTSGRGLAALAAAAVALVAAFVFVPALVAGGGYAGVDGTEPLARAFEESVVSYWQSGGRAHSSKLVELELVWRHWHAIKIAISLLLVVVLGGLAAGLWRRFLAVDSARRRLLFSYGAVAFAVTALVPCALTLLAVNAQSTAAPLSALLPLLPTDPPPGPVRQVMSEIAAGITDATSPHAANLALTTFAASERTYLWTLAITTAVLAVILCAAAGYAWRIAAVAANAPRRRRSLAITVTVGACLAVTATAATVVAATQPTVALTEIFSVV